jgi:hypothetical protein
MEKDPSSVTEKRRTLRTVRWLILFIALATAVAWFFKPPATEARTLFLHPDGQLSLGSRDGEKFLPSAMEDWPMPDDPYAFEHFVLDSPPETPASEWGRTIEKLACLGYARYQLRAAGESMNFRLPGMRERDYTTRTEPEWIDIRRNGGEKPKVDEKFDVVILGDDSTTCGEILAVTRPHRIPGRSLFVTGKGLWFRRAQDEDRDHQPPKRSLAARVRSLFRP